MKSAFWSVSLTLLIGAIGKADDTSEVLFEFAKSDASNQRQSVNDDVMGGVSDGKFRITDEQTMHFFGSLSLENNGGFSSVRTKAKKLGLEEGDSLVARVRGDGREYTLNLYLDRPRVAFSYRVAMPTKKDEWIEIKVPLDKFEATAFGNSVADAGSVLPEEVNAVGVLLGDKKSGPFKIEIAWIKVERSRTAADK